MHPLYQQAATITHDVIGAAITDGVSRLILPNANAPD
jgi:hypothetical protein